MERTEYALIPQYVEELDGAVVRQRRAERLRSVPLVRLGGVTREYRLGATTVRALRSVDLEVRSGEMVAIWGPSGSGKSTLLNILGLIDRPDSGQVTFAGEHIADLSEDMLADERSSFIGFVFQSFNLLPVLTALENVALPLEVQGVPPRHARERAAALLAATGLAEFAQFRPDRLSGGQRQRTAIARALVTRPALVVADEPTANLDSETARQIIGLMRSLQVQTGTTFVFATHDQRLLASVPRTVELRDGAIRQDIRGAAA